MKRPASTPLAVGLTTLLVLAFCSSAQAARNEDAFRKGMKALADKKYDEAISQFQKAIVSDSTESSEKVSGIFGGLFGRGDQYLPHLRLGEALLAKNDCAGALGALEE